jgi:hypothetical protein
MLIESCLNAWDVFSRRNLLAIVSFESAIHAYDFRPPVLALSTSHRKSAGNCEPHVLLCRKLLATVSFKLLPPRCHPRPGPRSRASPVFPANDDLRFQPLLIDYRRTALILPMQEQLWQTSDDHVTTHIVVPDR